MNTTPQAATDEAASSFIGDLEAVSGARRQFASYLHEMATTIGEAEAEGRTASGELALRPVQAELADVAASLEAGVFRLLVLGDMKRGKSTFLNALLGDNLLPRDVNPCTAVLTLLRYGEQTRVTVHFTGGREPQQLGIDEFRNEFTIPPDEAKRLEDTEHMAFQEVAYAVVETPLPLLERGVEIIDSPGLNDTEARNSLTLGFVRECHAILFVLSATQPWTLAEERYLDDYIRDRGLTVFFLVNLWDEILRRLDDEDDPVALREAEERVRGVFRANLADDCLVDGRDLFEQRVFEVSALRALRAVTNGHPLDGTGFPRFLEALRTFLVRERAMAEMMRARSTARRADQRVREAVETRIPLLEAPVEELEARGQAVEPEFRKLREIRDKVVAEVNESRNCLARNQAASFFDHLSGLTGTFEADFMRYQPEMGFLKFLRKDERSKFESALEGAFNRYLHDKIAQWTRHAEKEIQQEREALSRFASAYAVSYGEVTHTISDQLIGHKRRGVAAESVMPEAPLWERVVAGAGAVMVGDIAGGVMAGAGFFNWKRIAVNVVGVVAVAATAGVAFNIFLGPLGWLLTGMGLGGIQAERTRRRVIRTMKEELEKAIPQVATEGRSIVYENVDTYFSGYSAEVDRNITEDISSRESELDNLLAQKRKHEIDVRAETARLRRLESRVAAGREEVETAFDRMFSGTRGER